MKGGLSEKVKALYTSPLLSEVFQEWRTATLVGRLELITNNPLGLSEITSLLVKIAWSLWLAVIAL